MNFIGEIESSKYSYNSKHIGVIIPWADQGLGIQGRELYISLEKLGFKPFIFSFKPYLSTKDNPLMQVDSKEWDYKNIIFSKHNREERFLKMENREQWGTRIGFIMAAVG